MKPQLTPEQREIARQIGKLGGRPIKDTSEKAQKNRDRVAKHRDKKRGEQDERSAEKLSQHDAD